MVDADVELYIRSRFEKIKLLRETDKGEVWLASNREGEPVILKKINFVGLPYALLKKNPNSLWAKIIFCAEDDGETFVAEEFIGGENLFERLERKNFLTEQQAKNFLLQMCDGLKVLHGLGIIHRDIKPSNLILQNEKIIRLIDFDAARTFKADKSEDTKFLGTKGYAPPEQFGYGQTDPRSDIYSLGITFQKLLGRNCKGNLKKILSKCTELDPKNRYQSVEELKSALLEKKSSPHKKLLTAIVLTTAGIFLFQKAAVEENFSAPVEVKEIVAVEEKSPPEKILAVEQEKTFKFPEIKMPVNEVERLEGRKVEGSEEKIFKSPPQKTVEDSPQKVYRDYVRVKYFFNGARMDDWTDNFGQDIPNASCQIQVKNLDGFQSAGNSTVKFPAWNLVVKVENLTDKTFSNPQVELTYNDNGRTEKKFFRGTAIAAGKETSFTIPLNQFTVTNPKAAGDSFRSLHNFKIKFSGAGANIYGSEFAYDFVFTP